MAGQVEDESGPHGLSGEAGARPACEERYVVLGGGRDRGLDVTGVPGKTTPRGVMAYMLASREKRWRV